MFGLGKNNINIKDAAEKKGKVIFLDVRTEEEYRSGHIPGSININFYDSSFAKRLENLDKTREYIVYCERGGRASKATRLMRSEHFDDAYNLQGGITAWKQEGNPVDG